MEWNFRRLPFPVDRTRQADLADSPVERARLEIGPPLFALGAAATIGYGWMTDHEISLPEPVTMLLLPGYRVMGGGETLMECILPGLCQHGHHTL